MSSAHLTHVRRWLLQSPPVEWAIQRLRELLIGALRQGPIPRHVAFVMDGNRRYARDHAIETVEGHNLGFEALARMLEVCYKSGVQVVTIYAFSIENFKRSKYEVNHLMDMAKIKLLQFAQHGELLQRYGAKIRILGQRDLIKPDVLEAIDRAVEMTSGNGRAVLNVCFPYTSRDEITTAIRSTVSSYSQPTRPHLKRPFSESHITRNIRTRQLSSVAEEQYRPQPTIPQSSEDSYASAFTDVESEESSLESLEMTDHGTVEKAPSSRTSANTSPPSYPFPNHKTSSTNYPDPERITSQTITSHTFTSDAPPLDLLIRTSGVERLSDFMLWQCHEHTRIVFLDCLWPEFDLWHFLPVLVEWQWKRRKDEEAEAARDRTGRRGLKAA
ncbi:cis-prenyltransferase [Elasticomyces elasticus]|nr:cis-prenyltransferase [Elasticomyces elasticus]